MKRIGYTIFLYLFALLTFLRSIKPLLTAANYSPRFRFKILFLEIKFLLKIIYSTVTFQKIKEEKFLRYRVNFANYLDFFCLFTEMFGTQEYKYFSSKRAPIIIDGGCNWGMSVIYFKHFYPDAYIIAIEANRKTLRYFKKNMRLNRFSRITVYNTLVAEKKGISPFFINNKDDGWSLSDTGVASLVRSRDDFSSVMVKTIQLSQLINKKISLLKLDIEGMEGEVLHEAQHKLRKIDEIIFEYHGGTKTPKNLLPNITSLLKKGGFVYTFSVSKNLIPRRKEDSLMIIHATNKNMHSESL